MVFFSFTFSCALINMKLFLCSLSNLPSFLVAIIELIESIQELKTGLVAIHTAAELVEEREGGREGERERGREGRREGGREGGERKRIKGKGGRMKG